VHSNRKLFSHDALLALREKARREGLTLVHCHGCFDIVHPGHIHHLQFARSMGDLLVVSVQKESGEAQLVGLVERHTSAVDSRAETTRFVDEGVGANLLARANNFEAA